MRIAWCSSDIWWLLPQTLEELDALCLKSWPRSKRPFLDFHYPLFCSREQRQSCTSVSDPSILQTAVNQLEGSQFRLAVVPQLVHLVKTSLLYSNHCPGKTSSSNTLLLFICSFSMLEDVRRVQRQPRLGHRLGSMRRNRTARHRALVFFGSTSACSI